MRNLTRNHDQSSDISSEESGKSFPRCGAGGAGRDGVAFGVITGADPGFLDRGFKSRKGGSFS